MSIRLEMLQVSRLAPKLLGDSTELVRAFLLEKQNEDGGFGDRDGRSDIYYTVFGLEGLLSLSSAPTVEDALGHERANRLERYLLEAETGRLDFVHACCLARCWAAWGRPCPSPELVLAIVEANRTADGGFHPMSGQTAGNAYGAYMALAAYEDLQRPFPEPLLVARTLKRLETPDGAWANEPGLPIGSTNATAAAVTFLRRLNLPIHDRVAEWLLHRIHAQGGFLAAPNAPIPDLLSTATTLHALGGLGVDLAPIQEQTLDFVDSLWTNEGGFFGHWSDDQADVEYTYYGLLALGHLSL